MDNNSPGISSDESVTSSYILPDRIQDVQLIEEGMIVVDNENVLSTAGIWNPMIIDKNGFTSITSESATFLSGGGGDDFDLEDGTVEDSFVMIPSIAEGTSLSFHDQLENDNLVKDFCNIETSVEENEIIQQFMDIQEPLSTLRSLLEDRLGISLKDYSFWLQDTQCLESHRNLVDQCVHGEGLVQINAQVKTEFGKKKINIVDVLKPAEEYVEIASDNNSKVEENEQSDSKPAVRWVVDSNFRKEQQRLNIPQDPKEWSTAQVRHWLVWAVRQFNLTQISLSDWSITGEELSQLSLDDFRKKVPSDPGDLFWTHLELLRKCKFTAVIQKKNDCESDKEEKSSPVKRVPRTLGSVPRALGSMKQKGCIRVSKTKSNKIVFVQEMNNSTNKSGTSGQIQLWQFLLDLLTDKKHRDAIQWQGDEGEFKLINPEMVASLWGERKNKPTMNYEKLSRALRYYYEGDMISKVQGKRFVYKFVCDLKALLGYSASQLNKLVTEAELNQVNIQSELFSFMGDVILKNEIDS